MGNDKDKYTRKGDKRFTLRIEQTLFDKLEASAKACRRSVGRQIEYILDLVLNKNKSDLEEPDIIEEMLNSIPQDVKENKQNKKRA